MPRPEQDGLLKHSLLLMAFQQVGNASTTGFQVLMGWTLSEAEYGTMASMLSLILIIGMPMDAVRSAMAHFTARLVQEGRRADIRPLMRRWYGYICWAAVPLVVAGIAGSGAFSAFFHLESRAHIIITACILGGTLFLPIFIGALQGLQAFVWFSITAHSWGIIRLAAAAVLVVVVSATALVGLTAQLVAVGGALLVGMWGFHRVMGRPDGDEQARHVAGTRTYVLRSLFILSGFAVLMNADIALVKHYLPEEAGTYARASTIARSVIFFTQPIAMAMFPKVASAGVTSSHNWRTLLKALLYAGACIAGIAVCFVALPQVPLFLLFNDRAPAAETVKLVRFLVLAMAPLGLTFVVMNFELAQHRFGATLPLVLCAAGFVGGVALFHQSVFHVVTVLGSMSVLALGLLVVGLPWRGRAEGTSNIER